MTRPLLSIDMQEVKVKIELPAMSPLESPGLHFLKSPGLFSPGLRSPELASPSLTTLSVPPKRRTRRFDTRSRNGCTTCKKRRVKCDESHPACNTCKRLNLTCHYGTKLLWEDEAIEKGISFGRSKQNKLIILQKNKNLEQHEKQLTLSQKSNKYVTWSKYTEGQLFLNTTYTDFRKLFTMITKEDFTKSEKMSGSSEISKVAISNGSFISDQVFSKNFTTTVNFYNTEFLTNNPKLEEGIFNYFVDKICPSCISYPNNHSTFGFPTTSRNPDLNPYLYLIAPLALKSSILYKTLIIVASRQLSLLGNYNFENLANLYTSNVLTTLPQLIKRKQDENHQDWDEIMATVLMLCFIDISTSCDNSWLVHLNGAKQFLKEHAIKTNITPVNIFFKRWFLCHEVMGQTAWYHDTIAPDDEYSYNLKNDLDTKIDLVLGCSPCLIAIINRITKLGDQYENGHNEQYIITQRDLLEKQLNSLKQTLELNELDLEQQANIIKISEIKRLATLIYLFARIDLEHFHVHQGQSAASKAFNEKFKNVRRITTEIKLHIVSLPFVSMSLLWTLFIIGIVAVDTEEERWFVLSRLVKMEKIRELASIKIARRCVEGVWKEKDMRGGGTVRWRELVGGKVNTISLA